MSTGDALARIATSSAWRRVLRLRTVSIVAFSLVLAGCGESRLVGLGVTDPDSLPATPVDTGPPLDTVQLEPPPGVQLSAGGRKNCLLAPDGSVVCWGGPIGAVDIPPHRIADTFDSHGQRVRFAQVSVGSVLCALSTSGEAYCPPSARTSTAGDTASAQLTLVPFPTRHRFRALVSGNGTSCALTPGSVIYCWGDGEVGALGDNNFGVGYSSPVPVAVASPLRFASLASGGGVVQCALSVDASPYCWGGAKGTVSFMPALPGDCTNTFWQWYLGRPCAAPTPVAGTGPLLLITTGLETSCGLDRSGRAYCWGVGDLGQLGNGAAMPSVAAVPVAGGLSFQQLAVGGVGFVCGLATSGDAYCWGNNFRGYLGTGDVGNSAIPRLVSGGKSFTDIAVGSATACGMATTGRVWCWGFGGYGQLGRAPSLGDSNVPVEVTIP